VSNGKVPYRPATPADNHALHDVFLETIPEIDSSVALDRYLITSPPFFV
jgi:hypothetical protein